ncbi:RNA polymerase sigma factor [Sinomicrobium sp.]
MRYSLQNSVDLVKDLQSGDERAFEYLFNSLYDDLTYFILGFCNDVQTAEDIVQATFIRLWEKKESISFHTSLKSYMYSACYNQFVDHFRKNKNITSVAIDLYQEILVSEDENQEHREAMQQKLKNAINTLPDKCKEIVILHKLKGYKYQEIAEMLNISKKTVENQLWKAYKILRSFINSKD